MNSIELVKIDEIKGPGKYMCVGGPFGSALSRKHYVEDAGVPVIRGTNLGGDRFQDEGFVFVSEEKADELHRNLAFPGDLVFTQRGTLGQVAIIPESVRFLRYVVSQSQMKLTVNEEIADPYYVYLYFRSAIAKRIIADRAIVGGVPHINLGILKEIEVPLPTMARQRAIVAIIGDLDGKLEVNREINQTLEQIAQAIFKSWFVDFEPVKAKQHVRSLGGNEEQTERVAQAVIAGAVNLDIITTATDLNVLDQQLTEALSKKLAHQTGEQHKQLTTTASHFPDQLVESELGLIPEGWEVSTIDDEVVIVGGATPSTKKEEFWVDGDINWTTPKDLSGIPDMVLLRTNRRITEAGLEKISSGLLPVNTVLMSSRAPVGYLALAKIPVAINQGYIAMKCNARLSPEYVIQWANSVMDDIKQRASGTTFAEISKKNFRIIPLVVPRPGELVSYSVMAKLIYNQITNNVAESTSLESVRDALLPRLLSGELVASKPMRVTADIV